MTRRWRGTINVPPVPERVDEATKLAKPLNLDECYHDGLERCAATARAITRLDRQDAILTADGPSPWNMGHTFQGKEITPSSILRAQDYATRKMFSCPPDGESFVDWSLRWHRFVRIVDMLAEDIRIGVVTHNRNIQYLYSIHGEQFYPKLYDVVGPDFLSVHVYHNGMIAPWIGNSSVSGLFITRHVETSWGT